MIFYYFLLIILTLSCFYLVNKYKQSKTGRIKHFFFYQKLYTMVFPPQQKKGQAGKLSIPACHHIIVS